MAFLCSGRDLFCYSTSCTQNLNNLSFSTPERDFKNIYGNIECYGLWRKSILMGNWWVPLPSGDHSGNSASPASSWIPCQRPVQWLSHLLRNNCSYLRRPACFVRRAVTPWSLGNRWGPRVFSVGWKRPKNSPGAVGSGTVGAAWVHSRPIARHGVRSGAITRPDPGPQPPEWSGLLYKPPIYWVSWALLCKCLALSLTLPILTKSYQTVPNVKSLSSEDYEGFQRILGVMWWKPWFHHDKAITHLSSRPETGRVFWHNLGVLSTLFFHFTLCPELENFF